MIWRRKQIMDNQILENNVEIMQDTFNYTGYQVVRREFFSHIYDPSISFAQGKIYVNKAALNKLPEVTYVQILINPTEHKLIIHPCNENDKDSFAWNRTDKHGTIVPKQVTCRIFFGKLFDLMDWNQNYRYKLLGRLVITENEKLMVFDMTSTEVFERKTLENGKQKTSRIPVFPSNWKEQFGLSVEEHRKRMNVNIFDGYAVFGIKEKRNLFNEDQL